MNIVIILTLTVLICSAVGEDACTNDINKAAATKQSSVWWDELSVWAYDGDSDTKKRLFETCTSTDSDTEPWWYADLCREVTVYGVIITSHEGFELELSYLRIAVTNNEPPEDFPESDIGGYRMAPMQGTLKLKFKEPLKGRYVVIKRGSKSYLKLCEVEWVTSAEELTADFIDGDNMAEVKQSSTFFIYGDPELALDGKSETWYSYCSQTNRENEPWWYVKFTDEVKIYGVLIYNHDEQKDRLTKFDVAVTNNEPPQDYGRADVGAYREAAFDVTLKLKFSLPKTGRYLVIKLRKEDSLTLCEVEWVTSEAEVAGFVDSDPIPEN